MEQYLYKKNKSTQLYVERRNHGANNQSFVDERTLASTQSQLKELVNTTAQFSTLPPLEINHRDGGEDGGRGRGGSRGRGRGGSRGRGRGGSRGRGRGGYTGTGTGTDTSSAPSVFCGIEATNDNKSQFTQLLSDRYEGAEKETTTYYYTEEQQIPTVTLRCRIDGRQVSAHVHYGKDEPHVKFAGNAWIKGIRDFDFPTPPSIVTAAPAWVDVSGYFPPPSVE